MIKLRHVIPNRVAKPTSAPRERFPPATIAVSTPPTRANGRLVRMMGRFSFAPKSAEEKAKWADYDARHMLADLNPKPDQVTIAIGTGLASTALAVPNVAEGCSAITVWRQTARAAGADPSVTQIKEKERRRGITASDSHQCPAVR